MNNKQYQFKVLGIKRKIERVNYLGGKCIKCGEDNPFILCFHHKGDKEFGINTKRTSNLESIKSELDKCDLMCNNCHVEHHYIENKSRYKVNKLIYLDWIGYSRCIKCGYSKCIQCLEFHHLENKVFKISSISKINLESIKNKINEEISKCILLCKNCHILGHSNYEFYIKNKESIDGYNKRKISKKLNREYVKQLYLGGMSQIKISKFLSAGKSTISEIIKELKLK